MKKLILLGTTLVLAVSLVACKDDKTDEDTIDNGVEEITTNKDNNTNFNSDGGSDSHSHDGEDTNKDREIVVGANEVTTYLDSVFGYSSATSTKVSVEGLALDKFSIDQPTLRGDLYLGVTDEEVLYLDFDGYFDDDNEIEQIFTELVSMYGGNTEYITKKYPSEYGKILDYLNDDISATMSLNSFEREAKLVLMVIE